MHHNRWTREKAIKAQESVACLRVLGCNVECESESIFHIRLVYDLQDEKFICFLHIEMKYFRAYLRPSTIKINSSLIHPQQFHSPPAHLQISF